MKEEKKLIGKSQPDLGKSRKEGKSPGNVGASELGSGHLKTVLIWTQ